MKRRLFNKILTSVLVLSTILTLSIAQAETKRVSCVGDSITFGHGIADRNKNSYPAQLGTMLGSEYEVRNFGVSGATLLKKGDKPYWNLGAFTESKDFQPHIVIIKLGTNDSKPQNWKHKADFVANYVEMVKIFQGLKSKPKVYICYAAPVIESRWGINEQVVKGEGMPLIDQIAKETRTTIIDLHTPLADKPEMLPDKIHPNAAGATVIAEVVKKAITTKPEPPREKVLKAKNDRAVRTWTSTTGKTLEAALVNVSRYSVELKTKSGSGKKIELKYLSDADLEYIESEKE
jgi:acyl-CoA thioesterase-1